MWVGAEEGAPAAPSRPPPGRRFGRVRCAIGPGVPVGGKMTSAAGWIIKAPAEPRTQSAPSRRRTAVGPLLAWQSCSASACPTAHRPSRLQTVCIPRSHRHHAPLPADRLRPAARATLAPALRSQARDTTEGGCCRGDAGLVRGVDRCGAQEGAESPERQTPLGLAPSKQGLLGFIPQPRENIDPCTSPVPPMCPAGPAARKEQGAPRKSRHQGCVAGGCRTQLSRIGGGTLTAEEGYATLVPVKVICATWVHSFTCPLFSPTGPENPARGGAGGFPGSWWQSEKG